MVAFAELHKHVLLAVSHYGGHNLKGIGRFSVFLGCFVKNPLSRRCVPYLTTINPSDRSSTKDLLLHSILLE